MLVKNIMISVDKLTTLNLSDTVEQAISTINSHNLLSLPVVKDKKFIGIISKQCLYADYFQQEQSKEDFLKRPISEFMKTSISTVYKDDLVETAVHMLNAKNLQFIPVLNNKDEFAGIITHKAVFSTLTNVFGFGHTRMVVTTHDMKGRLAKLADIIYKQGGNIISIVELDIEVMDLRQIVLRVDVENVKKLSKKLEENGFRVRRIDEI
ncbi:MAG: hypothetical protein ATN33_01780 [Epulopiscium sp. Nele67-Bin001]|nr:MAG: hypothetical protein ATN33_01780 [Epulopiscium sp. Nele67-Bin001]